MPKTPALVLLILSLLVTAPLRAQPSEADRATARALASEGYRALQQKNYEVAADRFGRADALVHAPTLVVDHARALIGLGKLVEAHERFELVVREGVDPDEPESWQKAFTTATKELEALKPRLAWVTIVVKGPTEPAVTVDDASVPVAALGVRRAINPGTRLVRASAAGYLPGEKSLTVAEGEEQSVELELTVDPHAQQATTTPASGPSSDLSPKRRSNVLAFVAIGVGGAALAFGGVTGGLALAKRKDLKQECDDEGRCPSSERDNVEAYQRLGLMSGIGLGVGVAAAAVGVTLLLTNKKSAAETSAGVHPYVGILSAGATGRF